MTPLFVKVVKKLKLATDSTVVDSTPLVRMIYLAIKDKSLQEDVLDIVQ